MSRDRIQYGTTVDQVTIWGAIDWLEQRSCDTFRRGYGCGHPGCSRNEQAALHLKALANGEPLDRDTVALVLKQVQSKRCHGRAARTRSAIMNEPYIQFIESYLAQRKAAA